MITTTIVETKKAFDKNYNHTFKHKRPFDKKEYDRFAKSLFSNLLGGVGYFYGDSIVDLSYAPEYEEENEGFWTEAAEARSRAEPQSVGPYSLFSAVPSRPFFPRGFLWDEGFHLIPILEWDVELTLEILKSWFHTMDEDGWIAREQILGHEARSKVPREFQVQYPHYANPPTLFIVLETLVDKMELKTKSSPALSTEQKAYLLDSLRTLYPQLKQHFSWYRKTQRGDLRSYERPYPPYREAYRWRGRTQTHCLTSGLDDYPRAKIPHPGEIHIDLMSWMAMMGRSMAKIAHILGETDDAEEFGLHSKGVTMNINTLLWSEEQQCYCDATIDEFEEHTLVCHKGYISIFPFMTGLLHDDSVHTGAVLNLINDPDHLWSAHGIRSLSKSDPYYGTEENYWRSPVWVNINYLILTNLRLVAEGDGPHRHKAQKMYNELRQNLVQTVYESWKNTGFAWEQYNPETGEGQRTQHFTGWTSLIVQIMCMPELGVPEKEL